MSTAEERPPLPRRKEWALVVPGTSIITGFASKQDVRCFATEWAIDGAIAVQTCTSGWAAAAMARFEADTGVPGYDSSMFDDD